MFIATRRDDPSAHPLVVKRIRADLAGNEEYLRRFVLEAQVASRLSHQNLVRFREFGRVGSCRYIAMDQVRGYSLHRVIDRVFEKKAPPPLPVALHLVAGILDGLAAMHDVRDDEGRPRPMIHRDVNPKNVIVGADGRPVIIDFGITKDMLGPSLTLPGKVIGTARYMAPEHRRAEYVDARADVFSVGVIMFELVLARHPWRPLESIKELLRVTFDPPEIPPELRALLPADVEEVVLRAVACDPAERFEGARAMSAALRAGPSFAALGPGGADGDALTRAWLSTLDLAVDLDLDTPVLDHAPPGGPSWSSEGELIGDGLPPAVAPAPPRAPRPLPNRPPPDARVLSIPPLPPTREARLAAGGELRELTATPGRSMWVSGLVVALLLAFLALAAVALLTGRGG